MARCPGARSGRNMAAMAEAAPIVLVTGATSGIGAALRDQFEVGRARIPAWSGDLGTAAAARALLVAVASAFGGLYGSILALIGTRLVWDRPNHSDDDPP